jgi:RND family efflux transporter MFP subunit
MKAQLSLSVPVVVIGALVMIGVGAGGALLMRRASPNGMPAAHVEQASPVHETGPDVVLTLTPEAVTRAGIAVAPVTTGQVHRALDLPATVEPNAYRRVDLTPLVAGRITDVSGQIGDHVRRGQSLATVYSPDLADAETQFLALTAELEVAHREAVRLEHLVESGVASQRDLDRAQADHAAHAAHVETARARLRLLGVSDAQVAKLHDASDVEATTAITAPIDGVILSRKANVGLNVDLSTPLFTIADLSTVWIVASVYEQDLGRIRVGSAVTVTTPTDRANAVSARVDYIDPQVNAETRAAQVRVEVPNAASQLRLGMYAIVQVQDATRADALLVPKAAVQTVGNHSIVYVADRAIAGRFTARNVKLGASTGESVEILSGLSVGESVVTAGSFALRAEQDRLGLGASGPGRSQ